MVFPGRFPYRTRMSDHGFAADFGPFGDVTWLNCAHQGALPRVSANEAREAVEWKVCPSALTQERFNDVPARLKHALARLLNASPDEIVLGNSASYGLHLLANGIPWREGDEILLVRGDFPSVILPWLGLDRRGVRVQQLDPQGVSIDPEELAAHITSRTRLFCTTWVHSFLGHVVDMEGLGAVCREHGVPFVLNTSQGLGARPLDVTTAPVDAITNVGFKWLCGPYGTGFCWMRPALLASLEYNQSYWLAMQTAADLEQEGDVVVREDLGARRYDVFGTANFFNFKPWAASLEYLLEIGLERVAAYDQELVGRLVGGLDRSKYALVSPERGRERSTLTVLRPVEAERATEIYEELRGQQIHVALRRGNLRVSPHLFNTPGDIDRALAILNDV